MRNEACKGIDGDPRTLTSVATSAVTPRPGTTLESPNGRSGPIAREGWPIVASFFGLTAIAAVVGVVFLHPWAGVAVGLVGLVVSAWCLWFFRDPVRPIPQASGVVVSPADGRVVAVDSMPPPAEARAASESAGLSTPDSRWMRISVFMNVFDVHVNRAPVAGVVAAAIHKDGLFVNAALPKASEENERLSLVQRMEGGQAAISVQIAGLIARRIICRVKPGADLAKGERFGLIRFGSRVDVFLPAGAVASVKPGDRCLAGQTILATLASGQGAFGEEPSLAGRS